MLEQLRSQAALVQISHTPSHVFFVRGKTEEELWKNAHWAVLDFVEHLVGQCAQDPRQIGRVTDLARNAARYGREALELPSPYELRSPACFDVPYFPKHRWALSATQEGGLALHTAQSFGTDVAVIKRDADTLAKIATGGEYSPLVRALDEVRMRVALEPCIPASDTEAEDGRDWYDLGPIFALLSQAGLTCSTSTANSNATSVTVKSDVASITSAIYRRWVGMGTDMWLTCEGFPDLRASFDVGDEANSDLTETARAGLVMHKDTRIGVYRRTGYFKPLRCALVLSWNGLAHEPLSYARQEACCRAALRVEHLAALQALSV